MCVFQLACNCRHGLHFWPLIAPFDETGGRPCPTRASEKGRRHRYCISQHLLQQTGATGKGWRLPTKELEGLVAGTVGDFLKDECRIVEALQLTDAAQPAGRV